MEQRGKSAGLDKSKIAFCVLVKEASFTPSGHSNGVTKRSRCLTVERVSDVPSAIVRTWERTCGNGICLLRV